MSDSVAPRITPSTPVASAVGAPPGPSGAATASGDPPLLTGGLAVPTLPLEVCSRGVDWLTVSMSSDMSHEIRNGPFVGRSLQNFSARAVKFECGERLMCFGGEVSRRWNPLQRSRRWSFDYESWEFDGSHADWWARQLPSEVSPSRVDVAYDHRCPDDFLACDFAAAILPYLERRGITPGVSGEGSYLTRYVGAKTSPRRVRIYRKDIQAPALAVMGIGPLLRVELILREDHAKRFWLSWTQNGPEAAFRGAAEAIQHMTGWVVQADAEPLPQLDVPPSIDFGQQVFEFLRQHGATLRAARANGVDLSDLAEYAPVPERTRFREDARRRQWEQAGPAQVVEVVRALMQHASRGSGTFANGVG